MIVKTKKEVNLITLIVKAKVRYWEDSKVNGVEDFEEDDAVMPCKLFEMPCKLFDDWNPKIDIDSGIIRNWRFGTTAEIHYKVCDECYWELRDENHELIKMGNGYVPKTLCPKADGYGDYIIMDIDKDGKIKDWKFNPKDFEL